MKVILHQKATDLRKKGQSIKSIARTLRVSSGSVSRWCRDIKLSTPQRQKLDTAQRAAAHKALSPWIQERKNAKTKNLQEQKELAFHDVGTFTKRDLLMLGLGLYWGEGYKRGSDEWGFTNSDPDMIRLVLKWLEEQYGVERKRIIARLTINDRYKNETNRLTKEWSRALKISPGQFNKPSFIHGYGKPSREARTYRGTLRIKLRSGTSLRRRILASLSVIQNQSAPNSRKTAS